MYLENPSLTRHRTREEQSTDNTLVTMKLNSASHHALLEVIEDKERELSRIRQVASVAAQEESKGLEVKLLELQQDCNRHIELLYDKDETIQRLQDRLLQMERDHLQATEKVKKSCEELSSVQIVKATVKAEEDITKRLQREYEDRISRKREDLEKEYQSVLINQIRDQEVMLYDKFDREIANREKVYVQDVNDLQRCIDMKDKEILELEYSTEQKYKERENRILDEIKLRLEGETRNRLEDCERQWKIRMRSLEEEKGQYERELNRIGQDRLQFEVDNRELNWKVEELLSIIQHIQGEAEDKCKDFEMHKKQFKREINEWEQKIALLETLLKDGEENHQRRLHKVEKRNKMDIKDFSNTIKKLKKGIVTLKDERGEADELAKEKEEEIHISRQQLKEKVASLRKECLGLRKEIDIMRTKSLIDTRSESKQKADFVRTLKDSEEAEHSNRRQMRLEHEVEVERIAKQHREEKLCFVRERDDAVIQMDRLEVQIREENDECKVARNELASIENSLRKELQALKKQNDSIGINNRDVVLQNSQLKETVKNMRNELETLMSSIMKARDQCTCSQSDRQKNSNKDQARQKSTERYVTCREIINTIKTHTIKRIIQSL